MNNLNKAKNKSWVNLMLLAYTFYLIFLLFANELLDLTIPYIVVYSFLFLTILLILIIKYLKFWTPLRYLIFYWLFFSFLISLIVVNNNRELYEYGSLVSVGLFDFGEDHYIELFFVTAIGIFAIICSIPIGLFTTKIIPNFLHSDRMFFHSKPIIVFYIVTVFYVILMLTAYKFDLGVLTKLIDKNFNFPIIGGIVYSRNIVFPLLLAFCIQTIVNRYGYVSKTQWLVLIILATIFAFTASSKKGIIFIVAPLIFYNIIYQSISTRTIIVTLISIFLIFPIIIYLTDVVRYSHYKYVEFNLDLLFSAPRDLEWTTFLSLMINRLVGLKELMSVIALDGKSFHLFFNRENLFQELYGFKDLTQVKALSHSLFGYFYVSGSYAFTFLGVLVVFSVLFFMDSIFKSKNTHVVGTYISVILFFDVFGGQVIRMLTITFPIILVMVYMYGLIFIKLKIRFK